VQAITSATIPQNPAAVRLFEQLGFSHTHTVDMWPSSASLASYEQAVGFVPGAPEQPEFHTSLIDHVQGKGQRRGASACKISLIAVCPTNTSDWARYTMICVGCMLSVCYL
jgi:hypothetical protein